MVVFTFLAKKDKEMGFQRDRDSIDDEGAGESSNQREPEYCMSMSLIENLIMMAERAIHRSGGIANRIHTETKCSGNRRNCQGENRQ